MTSSYQGLAGNRGSGVDPTPEFLPAQQQANQKLEQGIDRLNQSINSNDATRLENAKRSGDDLKALARLSKTFGTALGAYHTEQIKKYQSQGQALAALNITDQDKLLAAQDKYEEEQKNQQESIDKLTDKARNDAKPYHVINGIKKLNAYHLDEIQKVRIADITTEISTGFRDFYTENGGANMSRADQLGLVDQHITDNLDKFSGFNPGFITKYGLPALAKFKQQERKDIDFQWGQTTSAQTVDRAINTLLTDGNIGNYVNSVANTVDSKGKVRGPAQAYRYLVDSVLPEAIKANLVSVTDVQEMFDNSEMPGMGGQSYADLKKADVQNLVELIEADVNADFSRGQKTKDARFTVQEDEWMQSVDISTLTNESIEERQNQFIAEFGKRSSKLDQYKLALSVDAVQLKEADKAAQRLIETNSLTSARLAKLPWQIQQRYASIAATTDRVSADNYKVQEDSIKDAVEAKASVTPLGTRDPSVGVVTSIYQRKFHENLRMQLEADNPNALDDALSITLQDFKTWVDDPANFSGTGYKIFSDAATSQSLQASARQEQDRINSIVRTFGDDSLDQTDVVKSTILRNDAKNFGKKGFNHHPQILRLSQLLQVDPITATNRMIEAYNLANQAQGNPIPLISLSKGAEIIRDELPPQAKAKYFSRLGQVTPNTSLQVMSQIPGGYRPEMVPMGFGEIISEAAEKYDIPPGILAALLEQESEYRPEVIYDTSGKYDSSSGAKGIAQIIPKYHPTVKNPYDPNEAIPYAASYLRQMMDTYGFDLRTAIYAYNTGQGNVLEKIGVENLNTKAHKKFSEESFNYYPGVIKRAAKYGYKAAFGDPSLMRPVFQ